MNFLLRPDDAHKGMMGHSLLIAGKYGMAGAGILAAKACLRSGVGKVTVHIPRRNNDILQISVPEAIVSHDSDDFIVTDISVLKDEIIKGRYQSVAIGPGLGTDEKTASVLKSLLSDMQDGVNTPLVLDADALNILSQHIDFFPLMPKNTILTPHPMELRRMVSSYLGYIGDVDDKIASLLASKIDCHVILKGHRTAICHPDGRVSYNETGNSGMATAGSGDVLTGVLAGLLARGYAPDEACVLGTYLHGLAGDIAVKDIGRESLVASDIISYLPKAFLDSGCR